MSLCGQEARASLFIDGELPADEHRAFEEHLATCTQCPQTLDAYLEVEAAAVRVLMSERRSFGPGLVAAILLALFALAVTGMFWGLSDSVARADNQPSANTPARAPVPAVAGDRSSRGRR